MEWCLESSHYADDKLLLEVDLENALNQVERVPVYKAIREHLSEILLWTEAS